MRFCACQSSAVLCDSSFTAVAACATYLFASRPAGLQICFSWTLVLYETNIFVLADFFFQRRNCRGFQPVPHDDDGDDDGGDGDDDGGGGDDDGDDDDGGGDGGDGGGDGDDGGGDGDDGGDGDGNDGGDDDGGDGDGERRMSAKQKIEIVIQNALQG